MHIGTQAIMLTENINYIISLINNNYYRKLDEFSYYGDLQ